MMMKIRKRGTILGALMAVLMMALSACDNPFGGDDDTLIRLENATQLELTNVTFSSGHDPIDFDRIAPGDRTEYVEVERSYSYGYLKVTANGGEYTMQPIDYVGEEEIGPGRFTFRITLTQGGVSTTLRRDD
ncbi:MAG TPA: hypothetical protein VFR81_02620 [Longimicrobium sp.]|nr:hypothetical protein [Longimicrobium sp.]